MLFLQNPVIPEVVPTPFKNLKSLTLGAIMHCNDDIGWVTMLLEVAPVLESFQIEVWWKLRFTSDCIY